jgi:hypothetical protein
MKFLGIIALVAVMGFTFAACGDDDGKDDGGGSTSVPITKVQVYNRDGTPYTESGTIKYRLNADRDKTIDVGIVTNGKLTLSLPSSSDMNTFLGRTETHLLYDTLRLYPEEFYLSYEGQKEKKPYSVWYAYSKTDVKENSSYSGTVYKMDAKAGWIKLLGIQTGEYTTTYTTDLSGLPSNMKWTLYN